MKTRQSDRSANAVNSAADPSNSVAVFPGGRVHRQITQNRPWKKIICGGKLVVVKVAVDGHWLLDSNSAKFSKFSQLFSKKLRPESKKWYNPSNNIRLYCCCTLKSWAVANFLMGGREKSRNGRGFWWMWPWILLRTWQHRSAVVSRAPLRTQDWNTRYRSSNKFTTWFYRRKAKM